MSSALLQPYQLGDLTLANRIALAPMTRARAGESRIPNAIMAEYYAQRANAGLVITEATTISAQANGWIHSPGIYTAEMTEGWKPVVKAVHDRGSKIYMQLWHCGRASHSSFHNGAAIVAPSAIAIVGDYIHTPIGKQPYEIPRALESDEIPGIIADYAKAATAAKAAGFDGVEIHSANGYLLDSFLQSKTNQRTDRYGGSVENRFRILDEIVQAVANVWPTNHIAVRLSPNGVFNDMGAPDYREQFTYVATQLDKYKLSYLHVMDGLAFGFHSLGEPMTLKDFRGCYRGPLMGNCGYTHADGEQAISRGDADMIAYGRPFISNPDLVDRFKNGWPLTADAEMSDWYSPIGAQGYTSFPSYQG